MAAQRQAIEEQQTAFWASLPSREAQTAELMAARRQAVEEVQTAFWAGLFEVPKTIPHDRPPMAATRTRMHSAWKNKRARHRKRKRESFSCNTHPPLLLPICLHSPLNPRFASLRKRGHEFG
jgi:hypothetical protein